MITTFSASPVMRSAGFQNSDSTATNKLVSVFCYDRAGHVADVPYNVQFFR